MQISQLKTCIRNLCAAMLLALAAPSMAGDGRDIVASCETACTETCDAWNVPRCVANCVATGKPDCVSNPAPDSCTGECGSHCPPWKSPTEYANCLVSCADTGDWACYSEGELALPKSCNDTITDWEEITREIAQGERPSEKQLIEASAAMAACFKALLGPPVPAQTCGD